MNQPRQPVEKVIRDNQQRWMRIREVKGAAPAVHEGRPAIKIFVTQITPALREKFPLQQAGYTVLLHEIPAIRAQNPDLDIDIHPADDNA